MMSPTRRTEVAVTAMALTAMVLSALCTILPVAPLRAQGAPTASPVDRLAWIAGCWQRTGGSGANSSVVEEQWMAPRGGMMLGMGRTTAAGRVREFESLRIFAAGDTLVYGSTPSGQAYGEFRASPAAQHADARAIVFENLAHDFPQRIGYRAVGTDSLLAYIEGPRGGTTRRIDFPYVRVRCPG